MDRQKRRRRGGGGGGGGGEGPFSGLSGALDSGSTALETSLSLLNLSSFTLGVTRAPGGAAGRVTSWALMRPDSPSNVCFPFSRIHLFSVGRVMNSRVYVFMYFCLNRTLLCSVRRLSSGLTAGCSDVVFSCGRERKVTKETFVTKVGSCRCR